MSELQTKPVHKTSIGEIMLDENTGLYDADVMLDEVADHLQAAANSLTKWSKLIRSRHAVQTQHGETSGFTVHGENAPPSKLAQVRLF